MVRGAPHVWLRRLISGGVARDGADPAAGADQSAAPAAPRIKPPASHPVTAGVAVAVWVAATAVLGYQAGLALDRLLTWVGGGLSLALALSLFLAKERAELRRKTLEACEKQFLDKDLRQAVAAVNQALAQGSFSLTDEAYLQNTYLVTALLNLVESHCKGAVNALYDFALVREWDLALADMLIRNFLVRPAGGTLPTEAFLGDDFPNMRAVFGPLFDAATRRPSEYRAAPPTAAAAFAAASRSHGFG